MRSGLSSSPVVLNGFIDSFDMDHYEIAECPACGNKLAEENLESM